MSELKASTVTKKKMDYIVVSGVLDTPPLGSTHYDMFWCQFLMEREGVLRFFEDGVWKISNHKDGVNMLTNGECLNLRTMGIE